MTTVTFEQDEELLQLEIKGHAGAGPYGADLVCSAVSALTGALVNAALDVEEYHARCTTKAEQALVTVSCRPEENAAERCEEMYRVILNGFGVLAMTEPEHVKLIYKGE